MISMNYVQGLLEVQRGLGHFHLSGSLTVIEQIKVPKSETYLDFFI
jgi:hypothetical protein